MFPLYNTTAFLYEHSAAFENPEETGAFLCGLLERHGCNPPGLIGDLGCGTGLMAGILAERGWQVLGVELSEAMLTVARQQASALSVAAQERITYAQGDITEFAPPTGMLLDGAVCLCNTINHLVGQHRVEAFAQCAYRALKPGGVLMLDSDTLETFRGFFNHEPTVVLDDGTHRLMRSCVFDEENGEAHHTARLERYTGQSLALVSEEAMVLQYHRETNLYATFLAAGFQVVHTEAFNPFPVLYQGFVPKVLWVLKKMA